MSRDSSCESHDHACTCKGQTAAQSLDELEFERGIWSAAQHGELNKVRQFLNNGKYGVNQRDSAGYTALHYAARNGHLDVCKLLAAQGTLIDASTRSGRATALHRACSAGKSAVVSFLLSMDANPALQDADGKTCLHRALESEHNDICEILRSRWPELENIADNKGHIS